MNAFAGQVALALKLNARNRMAMIYGFLFPLIFLVAFWAIYRHDKIPLALHMGELLTVTILGGACFGLPTTLVSERERGVWRRYRLTPAPAWTFVASILVARYVLLLAAALMQLALALAIGMPAPTDPLGLLVAFSCAAVAFMGLGMIIAMIADNVPAVQALGQCIFLPMLMIGGVAVRLESLPAWAQHLSAFFPGRYAVQAIQAGVTGRGAGGGGFELTALLVIGAAGFIAATRMFRWAPADRLLPRQGRAWLLLALGGWIAVGAAAELSGRVMKPIPSAEPPQRVEDYVAPAPRIEIPRVQASPAEAGAATSPVEDAAPAAPAPAQAPSPRSWRDVGEADFKNVAYERLPPDSGVIAPVGSPDEEVDPLVAEQLQEVREALVDWPPAQVADPVQKTRNLLYVAAVPDVLQMDPLERHLPALALERLQFDVPEGELKQALYWVATHPDEGDDSAARQLGALSLPAAQGSTKTARERVMIYAFKLLGRLNGDIAAP